MTRLVFSSRPYDLTHNDGQEILYCLEDIRRFWADLFRDDKRAMRKVDHVTVKALEVQAPGASSSDAMSLFRALKKGDVFGAFRLEERMKIWARLYTIDGFVPTLWAFFENFKYIKACAECVKSLVKIPSRTTLLGAVEKSFVAKSQRKDKTIIQEAEGVFSFRSGLTQNRIALHYRQLFLYVMRHLRELSPKSTKLERARNKRRTRTAPNKAAWYGLVELAERLGFRSAQIRKLKSRYSKYAKVPSHYELSRPILVVDGAGESAERRYACPFDLAYEQSRGFLFLNNMHSVDNSQGSSVTPFFVRRSVYLTFFGRLVSGHSDSDPSTTYPRVGESHAASTSTSRGLPSDQSQRTHDEDKLIGQEQGSENDPDPDIHSEPQDEQTTGEVSEEMHYESEERHSGEQEDNPEHIDETQGYMDQLPDLTRLFDSPPPPQSLQPYRKPPSIEDIEDGAINENDGDRNWDSIPPSIISSSFYSEGGFIETDAGTEDDVGREEQAPPNERSPLQEEAPWKAASPIQGTPEGTGEAAQNRFRFILRDGDDWITMEEYSFTASLSTLVGTTAEKHAAQGRHLLDIELWSLHPSQCFEAALAHSTHTILLFPAGPIHIDQQLAASAAALCPDAGPLQGQTRKRAAEEDVSQKRHIQKRHKR